LNRSNSSFVWARWAAAVGVASAVAAFSGNAAALPLVGISGSVRALYGMGLGDSQPIAVSLPEQVSTDWNPYTWGVGLRGGVTLLPLYLGVSFDYFFAETTQLDGFDVSGGRYQLLGNVGLEFGVPLFTVRPLLGLGYAQTRLDASSGADTTQHEFVVAPAAELLISLGLVDVSAELRYNFARVDSLVVGFGAGIRF
jgi:hypothetical protein